MDRSEAEFSEAHDKAEEYLDNQKEKLSSLANDTLTDIDSKKVLHGKAWKSKLWRCKLSENKILFINRKI